MVLLWWERIDAVIIFVGMRGKVLEVTHIILGFLWVGMVRVVITSVMLSCAKCC